MNLDDALGDGEPEARAAFLAGDGVFGLLKFLEELHLIRGGNAGPVSRTDRSNDPLLAPALRTTLPRVGKLDGVAHEVAQNLRQSPLVTAAPRRVGRDLGLELKVLVCRQRLDRAVHRKFAVGQAVEYKPTGAKLALLVRQMPKSS
jgi:hypothetical protein